MKNFLIHMYKLILLCLVKLLLQMRLPRKSSYKHCSNELLGYEVGLIRNIRLWVATHKHVFKHLLDPWMMCVNMLKVMYMVIFCLHLVTARAS